MKRDKIELLSRFFSKYIINQALFLNLSQEKVKEISSREKLSRLYSVSVILLI